ncbi:ParB/RepB/Spo0J family partition protein [Formicincola oecophyllae]|uniref:ParB/RepB/Spo0J family partition protein n=2 Tax=Formicincola oecophyllae TaxID=2558361 RepID=A0A4Y6UB58_9PROT|nr:ParB/RepB/Spo0J family partition protein [Formicincola oecophyllae]
MAPAGSAALESPPLPATPTVPCARLEPGPYQPRQTMAEDDLAELTASVARQGVLQPLLVRTNPKKPGHYHIVAGERRWRAACRAKLESVPVHIVTLSEQEALAAALVENLQRADLNPLEEAEALQRLMASCTVGPERLAEAIGKSRSHVVNMTRLLNLPAPVLEALRCGAITAGHGRALLGHADPLKGLERVVSHGLNVRQTEALARASQMGSLKGDMAGKSSRSTPWPQQRLQETSKRFSRHLGGQAQLRCSANGTTASLALQADTPQNLATMLEKLETLLANPHSPTT